MRSQLLRRRCAVLALTLVVAACGADDGSTEAATDTGTDPATVDEVEPDPCEIGDFPCDVTEATPEALERTTGIARDALPVLVADGVDAAVDHLLAVDEVVEAHAGDGSVVFRVEDGPLSWILVHDAEGGADQLEDEGALGPLEAPAPASAPFRSLRSSPPSVVGDDTTGDDRVDNRDAKRALVLAPYLWEFAPFDESPLVAQQLSQVPGYEGAITLAVNETEAAQDVTIEHWLSLDEYDAVFVSSHGSSSCWDQPTRQCASILSSGVVLPDGEPLTGGLYRGTTPLFRTADNTDDGEEDADQTSMAVELGLGRGFFTKNYPGGLDDVIVVLSACELGGLGGPALAASLGTDDVATYLWTESVPADTAFAATGALVEQLSLGLTSVEAFDHVVDVGLDERTYVNKAGREIHTELRHVPGSGTAVRLREVPTILYDGVPMRDGADVSDRVEGTPGDGEADELRVDLELAGVLDRSAFAVDYEIDGVLVPTSYDLDDATDGDLPHQLRVTHVVDVGFDLPEDGFELTAVVTLPEGGESRYTVDVAVGGACTFTVEVGGERHVAEPGDSVRWVATGSVVPDGIEEISFDIGLDAGGAVTGAAGTPPDGPGTSTFDKAVFTLRPGVGWIEAGEGSFQLTIEEYVPGERLVGLARGEVVPPEGGATTTALLTFSIVGPDAGLFGFSCEVGGED